MAAGNKVTLTFAGDSSDLERSFDRVGSGARDMGRQAEQSAGGIDRLGEAGGTTETRFLGLGAGISGVGTLLSGDLNAETAAMAMADLGDAVEHTVAPLLSQGRALIASGRAAVVSAGQHVASAAKVVAGWVLMGVQATVNAVKMAAAWLISLGPVGLVIGAIGAVIAILVALGFGFDDLKNVAEAVWNFILGVVQGFISWLSANWPLVLAILTGPIGLAVLAIVRHWDTIKAGFTAVKDWIGARIGDVVGFFTGLPSRLTAAAGNMWSFIKDTFKATLNWVIDKWNAFEFPSFTLPRVSLGPLGSFGGGTIGGWGLPTIPRLHQGGMFRAPAGQREGLAMLLDGERVSRPGSGGVVTLVIDSGSNPVDRMLADMLRRIIRVEHGGDVQAALGFG